MPNCAEARRSERVDFLHLGGEAELAVAQRPVPRLALLEDHPRRERRRLLVVLRRLDRFLGRQHRAVAALLHGDVGARRVLEAPVIGTAPAGDAVRMRSPASALADGERLQDFVLARLHEDLMLRRALRHSGRLGRLLGASRPDAERGEQDRQGGGRESVHGPTLFSRFYPQGKPRPAPRRGRAEEANGPGPISKRGRRNGLKRFVVSHAAHAGRAIG